MNDSTKKNWDEALLAFDPMYKDFSPEMALKLKREREEYEKEQEVYRTKRFEHFKNMTPHKMKQQVLIEGAFYIQMLRKNAEAPDNLKLNAGDMNAIELIWPTLVKMILDTPEEQPTPSISEGETSQKVHRILTAVVNGEISPKRAKTLIALVQSGMDVPEVSLALSQASKIILNRGE